MKNKEMTLPSGKKVKLKTPTIEELEKFSLFGVINCLLLIELFT